MDTLAHTEDAGRDAVDDNAADGDCGSSSADGDGRGHGKVNVTQNNERRLAHTSGH